MNIKTRACAAGAVLVMGCGVAAAAEAKPAVGPAAALREMAVDLGGGVKLELVLMPSDPSIQAVPGSPVVPSFWVGKHELTYGQWKAVTGEDRKGAPGPEHPVNGLLWEECQPFLDKLSAKASGAKFRLPTMDEWKYACRAASTNAFCCGPDVDAFAWYSANSSYATHPVGLKKPNAWGLYDTHGNVPEWCSDEVPNGHAVFGGGTYLYETIHGPNPVWDSRLTGHNQERGGHGLRVARDAK